MAFTPEYISNPAVLDKEIILMREVVIIDPMHGQRSIWHPFAVVAAFIEPLSGREYWQAAQSQSESTIRVVINYMQGITDRIKIRYGNRVFELKSPPINSREQNKFLELMCRELAA